MEHPAQAERLARAELRDKNSQEITASFSGMGDTRYVAGTILELKGWGKFDRKCVIKEARHAFSFDSGYADVSVCLGATEQIRRYERKRHGQEPQPCRLDPRRRVF